MQSVRVEPLEQRLALAVPSLVVDIVPGGEGSLAEGGGWTSSVPNGLTEFKDAIYFAASNSSSARGIWKTDGTAAGTAMVATIRPQREGPSYAQGTISQLTASGNYLFFREMKDSSPFTSPSTKLWRTDGTSSGTLLLRDFGVEIGNLTDVDGKLFFTVTTRNLSNTSQEIWRSDGTETGTVRLGVFARVSPSRESVNLNTPETFQRFVSIGGDIFFSAQQVPNGPSELVKWDSQAQSFQTLHECDGYSLTVANGKVLYAVGVLQSGIAGQTELWQTDGTVSGTARVATMSERGYRINGIVQLSSVIYVGAVGPQLSLPGKVMTVTGTAFTTVYETQRANVQELRVRPWGNDGFIVERYASGGASFSRLSAASLAVTRLADFRSWGGTGGNGDVYNDQDCVVAANGCLYFPASPAVSSIFSSSATELWESDGSVAGTRVLDVTPNWSSAPSNLAVFRGDILYGASSQTTARELWTLSNTGTINDPAISLAVSPASVTEDGATNLVYTFTRTGPTTSALTVNYTIGGNANLGTDYTGISATGTTATVTFAAGSATATVTADPTADTTAESDETVILTLASGTGYTIGTTTPVIGTITNVDLPAIITVVPASADKPEGKGSAPTPFTFTVTRTGVLTGASSVAWATAGSGARPATAADFANRRLPSGTVTFSAGETTKTITVNVVADSLAEPDEGFTVTLSSPSGAAIGVPAQASGTIRAFAPPKPPQRPIVQAPPRVIVAGPAAPVSRGTDAVFVVTLSSPAGAGKSITVNYTTLDGSARAGQHYTPTKASLVFTGQETTKTIFVPTNIDSATRPFKPDRFSLRLTSAPGAKIAGSVATATIAPIPPGLAISDMTLEEGNAGTKQARFVVTLGTPSDQPVTVDYATADGSAYVTDGDYTAIAKTTLTFTPGDKPYKIVTVDVAGDTTSEGNEIFFVNLSNASGAAITKATGTATIRNDDSAAKTASEFQITIDYATSLYGPVPKTIRDVCEKVAKRWSEVIVGDLPSVNDPALGFVDDFRMTVTMGLLGSATGSDGAFKTLANATPLELRKDGTKLPWLGITGIDPADTDPQLLEATLLHEFGHALGLVPEVWDRRNLVLSLTDGPLYVGLNAVREFNTIYGENVRGIPLEKEGGAGTKAAHWSEAVMKTELMTGFAEAPGTRMPLSTITVGALADIGYQVDYARADPFTRPAGVTVPSYASARLPNGGTGGGGSAPLRGGQPAALFAAAETLSQSGPTAVKSAVFASYRRRTALAS